MLEERRLSLAYCFRASAVQVAYYSERMEEPAVFLKAPYTKEQDLLAFLKESLEKLPEEVPLEQVHDICLTFPKLSKESVRKLQEMIGKLPFVDKRIYLQDFEESFYDFVMHQKKELRSNEVVYLKAQEGQLRAWTFKQDGSAYGHPHIIEESRFPDFSFGQQGAALDEQFAILMERFLGKRLVTSVFLDGKEFRGDWMQRSLRILCRGRRVFGVENVLVKGACYRAFRRVEKNADRREYFLGEQQITKNIGLYVEGTTGQEYCRMLNAGTNWYEAREQAIFLLDDCEQVTFLVDDVREEKKSFKKSISLDFLPKRPNLATKIFMSLSFQDVQTCQVTIADLGLGELYPSSRKSITEILIS